LDRKVQSVDERKIPAFTRYLTPAVEPISTSLTELFRRCWSSRL
jgi:hypothetical protein